MDVSKVIAAINKVHEELNTTVDTEVKAKCYKGLNRLNLAAKALGLAEQHLNAAVKQTAPKAAGAEGDAKAAKGKK